MRWFGIIVLLVGCGRIGFGGEDLAGDDAAGPQPAMCGARRVASLPLSEPVRRVRAAAVPGLGYAVALETAATIHVVRLDAGKGFVSFHSPFASDYLLHGVGALDQVVFISTDLTTEPAGYLKRLDPSWDTYGSPVSGGTAIYDPPLAGSAGTAWTGARAGEVIFIEEIDRDGARTGLSSDYLPETAFHASFSPSGDDVRAVVDRGDGTCEAFLIAPDGATRDRRRLDACMEPRGVGLPDGSAAIIARVPSVSDTYELRWIPPDGAGAALSLALGRHPEVRIAPFDDGRVLAAVTATTGGLALLAYGPEGTVDGSFSEGREPFDLLADALFWIVGSDLHVAEPCLR